MDSPTPKTFRVLDRESLSRAAQRLGANPVAFAASLSGGRRAGARLVAEFQRRASLFDELAAKYSSDDTRRLPDLSMLYRLLGPALARIYLKWLAAIDFSLSHTQLTIRQFINQPFLLSQQFITDTTDARRPQTLLRSFDDTAQRRSASLWPANGERAVLTRELVRRVSSERDIHTREQSQRLFAQLERLLEDSTRQAEPHLRPAATTRSFHAQSHAQQAFVSNLFNLLYINPRPHSNDTRALINFPELAQTLPASTLHTNFWKAINQSLHLLVAPRRDAPARERLDTRSRTREQSLPQSLTSEPLARMHEARALLAPQAKTHTQFTHVQDARRAAPTVTRSYFFTRADAHTSHYERAAAHLHRHLRAERTPAHAERTNVIQHAPDSTSRQTIFKVIPDDGSHRSETFQAMRRRAQGETAGTATTRQDATPALRSASRQILLHVAEGSALESFLLSLSNVPQRFFHAGRALSSTSAGRAAGSSVVLPRVFVAHDRSGALTSAATPATREPDAQLTFISKERTTRERLLMPFVAPPRVPEPNAGAEFLRQVADISRQEISRREVETRATLTTEQFAQKILETLAVRPDIYMHRRSAETPLLTTPRAASPESGAGAFAVFDAAAERLAMSPLRAQFAFVQSEGFARALTGSGASREATAGAAAGNLSEQVLRRTLDRIFVTRAARAERRAGDAATEKGDTFTARGERESLFERESAERQTRVAERLTAVEIFNSFASLASREPLVLSKQMVSLTERETLSRMGWLASGDVRAGTVAAGTDSGNRERLLMLERTHGRERVLIPVKTLSDSAGGARVSSDTRTRERERGLMHFVSVRRPERGREAKDTSVGAATATNGGGWGEPFLSSLSVFRSQNLLGGDVRGAEANTASVLTGRISRASLLLQRMFAPERGGTSARGAGGDGARGLEPFASGAERMSELILRRRASATGGAQASANELAGVQGEGAESAHGNMLERALVSLRREETAKPPRLSYVFAQTARQPSVSEQKVIRQVEQREVVELVKREVQTLMSSNAAAAAASMKLSRADYTHISDQVYSTLVRRLVAEKERLGLHSR